MHLITQYTGHKRSADSGEASLPDKLNDFYAWFDKANSSEPVSVSEMRDESPFVIQEWQVECKFERLKDARPQVHTISPPLLKFCAAQPAHVFALIYKWSLRVARVPAFYKMATVVPVPKSSVVSSGTDTCTNESVRGLHSILHKVVTAERTR